MRGAAVLTFAWRWRLFAVSSAAQQPPIRGLTGAPPRLARGYDAIFDARFDDVPPLLAADLPAGPDVKPASSSRPSRLWWQIQLDPYNRTRDAAFESRIEAAIAAIDAWTDARAQRAEAWFYLGGAYGARVQWRALRGEPARGRARRQRGSRRRSSVPSPSTRRWPTPTSASASITTTPLSRPPAARMLRWLLLLPGGDRAGGLDEMHARARARPARARRGRLPAAPHRCLVREAARARARYLAALDRAPSAQPALPPGRRRNPRLLHRRHCREPADVAVAARRGAAARGGSAEMAEVERAPRVASAARSALAERGRARTPARDHRVAPHRRPSGPSPARNSSSAMRSSISDGARNHQRRTARRSQLPAATIRCGSHRARASHCARSGEVRRAFDPTHHIRPS